MQVAGVKAIRDTPLGIVKQGEFAADGPCSTQRPSVQRQHVDAAIEARHIFACTARRREAGGLGIAEIGLRRSKVLLIGGHLRAMGLDTRIVTGRLVSGFREQLPDGFFRRGIVAFADRAMANTAVCADEIKGGPGIVVECAPDPEVIVDRDGISHAELAERGADIVDLLLEGEFRRMHADHDQPLIAVLVGPCANMREDAEAVDAGIGPEIDQHDLALQVCSLQRCGVEPLLVSRDRRQRLRQPALDGGIVGRRSGLRGRSAAQRLDQPAFEHGRGRQRELRQDARIESCPDSNCAKHDGGTQTAAQAIAPWHQVANLVECLPAEQHAGGERCRCAEPVGEQQEYGVDVRAVQGRAGQDQAQYRSGTGRPDKAGGDAEQQRSKRRPVRIGLVPADPARQLHAEQHQRCRQACREVWKHQRKAE